MLNWDWLRNQPAQPKAPEEALGPGWWATVRQLLRPPLLDHEVPEERLAAWLDTHTMRVHGALLDRLSLLRWDDESQRLILDDEYGQQLQQLPPWQPGAAGGGGSSIGSSNAEEEAA